MGEVGAAGGRLHAGLVGAGVAIAGTVGVAERGVWQAEGVQRRAFSVLADLAQDRIAAARVAGEVEYVRVVGGEIGRASWRERVGQYGSTPVVAVAVKKTTTSENTLQ